MGDMVKLRVPECFPFVKKETRCPYFFWISRHNQSCTLSTQIKSVQPATPYMINTTAPIVKPSATFTAGRYPAPHGIRICVSSPGTREEVEKGLGIIRVTLDEKPEIWQSVI